MTTRWPDGLRLGAGTFLAIPVPPPRVVDSQAGAVALLTAPLWGAVVGAAAGAGGAAMWWLAGLGGHRNALAALMVGAAVYALTALLTRGLHLDGLADTADALGSGRTGSDGLAIMRDSTVGAFAVVALIATAGLQMAAIATLFEAGLGAVAVATAAIVARTPLAWLARTGTPADDTGLGRTVVGAVAPRLAAAGGVVWCVAAAGLLVTAGVPWWTALGAALVALLPGLWLRRRAVVRFGALTGDILGAGVEVSSTLFLVLVALAT